MEAKEKGTGGESPGICCYHRHPCSRPRYQKYKFCVHHILEDTSSPFTSCEYVSRTSGRKCPNPALRSQRVSNLHALCEEHLRELIVKEQHQKQKRKLRKKRKSGKNAERNSASAKRQKLINYLAGYNKNLNKPHREDSSDSEVEEVHRPITDDWPLDTEDLGSNVDWDDFDPVNNEVYEPLRYADVLTPEEVVATAQSKLIRLQSLYIEQFKRLFHLLKERRRQYLHDRKKELSGTSFQTPVDENGDETGEVYALATYRKRTGVEALLRKKQLKRRQETEGSTSNFKSSTTMSRCSHTSNHIRCKEYCLPYTKYCSLHILSDPHQQLYKKCHAKHCLNPICILTARVYEPDAKSDDDNLEEIYFCALHAPLPKFTFAFPEPVKQEEEMVVDVETPGGVTEEAESQKMEDGIVGVVPLRSDANDDQDTQPVGAVGLNEQKICVEAMEIGQTEKISVGSGVAPPSVRYSEEVRTGVTLTELDGIASSRCGADPVPTKISEAEMPPIERKSVEKDTFSSENSSHGAVEKTAESDCQPCSTGTLSPMPTPASHCAYEKLSQTNRSDVETLATHSETGKLEGRIPSVVRSSPSPANENDSSQKTTHCQPDERTVHKEDAVADSKAIDLSKGPEQGDVVDLSVLKSGKEKEVIPAPRDTRSIHGDHVHGPSKKDEAVRLPAIDSPIAPMYLRNRGERKPSSAEEELAVVSLLSLCSGHPSDDNTPSSSTEQE